MSKRFNSFKKKPSNWKQKKTREPLKINENEFPELSNQINKKEDTNNTCYLNTLKKDIEVEDTDVVADIVKKNDNKLYNANDGKILSNWLNKYMIERQERINNGEKFYEMDPPTPPLSDYSSDDDNNVDDNINDFLD